MTEDYPFAALVPEFDVSDLQKSLHFWCEGLGFSVAYDRPAENFAYLELGKAQVMLCLYKAGFEWNVAPLEKPYGRGINFQIFVEQLQPILDRLAALEWPLYVQPEEKWYKTGNVESGQRQFLVQDPNGYLLRFAEKLGTRPVSSKSA